MAFCQACGTLVVPRATFCPKCGARVARPDAYNAAQASSRPVLADPVQDGTDFPVLPPVQSAGSRDGCGKLVLVGGAVLLLIGAIVVGGVLYIGRQVKNKIGEIKQEIDKDNPGTGPSGTSDPSSALSVLDKVLGGKSATSTNYEDVPGSFEIGKSFVDACPDFSGHAPATTPFNSLDPANIPLKAGLILVDSWRRFNGDVENILTVQSVQPVYVETQTSGIGFVNDKEVEGRKHTTLRVICRTDLETGRYCQTEWSQNFLEIFPGTTQFTIPTQLFHQLKSSGRANWAYMEYTVAGDPGRFVPVPIAGDFVRVESQDVPYDVIVNDQLLHLPAIHVKSSFNFAGHAKVAALYTGDAELHNVETEAYILDNPDNPICLLFRKGPEFQVRFVKIIIPPERPSTQIEQQLREEKKVISYGINSDFNQDTIKPESEPVLKEIAQAMADHPRNRRVEITLN